MNPIFIVLLVTASLCFAEKPKEAQKAIPDTITVHRVILDSVTIKALENSQILHDKSFDKLQHSFSTFVNKAIGIISILALFIGVLAWINFRSADKLRETVDKIKEDIKKQKQDLEVAEKSFENRISDLENELKKQIDNQKKKFESNIENQNREFKQKILDSENSLKEQIEKQDKEFKSNKDDTFRGIADSYISPIGISNISENIFNIFLNFSYYYNILKYNKVELNRNDFLNINYIKTTIKDNLDIIKISRISFFLFSLEMFIKYCKDKNKKEHLDITSETMKLFYDKFGEKEVLAEIEKIKKEIGINP